MYKEFFNGMMKDLCVIKVEINKEILECVHYSREYKAAYPKEIPFQTKVENKCGKKKQLSAELNQAIAVKKKAAEKVNGVVLLHGFTIHGLEEKLQATQSSYSIFNSSAVFLEDILKK